MFQIFLLGIYLQVEVLGQMIILCLTFLEIEKLFSKVVITFTNSTAARRFDVFHILASTCYLVLFCFLILAMLMGVKWYVMLDLTYIFLKTHEVEIISCAHWPLIYHFLKKISI